MSLTAVRVRVNQPVASLNGNEVGFFSPSVAQTLVDKGLGTALDAIPAGIAHAATGTPSKHAVRVAATLDIAANESERQVLAAQAGVLSSP